MSVFHRFTAAIAIFAGLSCLSSWAKEPTDPKTKEAEAAEVKEEAAGARLVKTNGGTLTLSGQNTYTGTTTVTAGVLQLGTAADANGVKEAQFEQYGKKVKISDDPKNGIKIERVTKKGGTDVTEKFEAKDIKELEKKYPEGFKLYNEYLGNQGPVAAPAAGVLQIQGFAQAVPAQGGVLPLPGGPIPLQAIPGGPFPVPPGGFQVIPGQGTIVVTAQATLAGPLQLEDITGMMQGWNDGLKSFGKAGKLKDSTPAAKENAKKQIAELKKQLSDLEKQLDAK